MATPAVPMCMADGGYDLRAIFKSGASVSYTHLAGSVTSGTLKQISSAADIVTLKLYYDLTVYNVTVENDGNGSASAAPASATMGGKITLTSTPNSGYRFKEWHIVSGDVTISGDVFTMPAGNEMCIRDSLRSGQDHFQRSRRSPGGHRLFWHCWHTEDGPLKQSL